MALEDLRLKSKAENKREAGKPHVTITKADAKLRAVLHPGEGAQAPWLQDILGELAAQSKTPQGLTGKGPWPQTKYLQAYNEKRRLEKEQKKLLKEAKTNETNL